MKKVHEVLSDKLLGEYHYVLRDFQSWRDVIVRKI